MSIKIICNICGKPYASDCSCRYNRTPTNEVPNEVPKFRSYAETIDYELKLWEEQLKAKEQELNEREKNLERLLSERDYFWKSKIATIGILPTLPLIPNDQSSNKHTSLSGSSNGDEGRSSSVSINKNLGADLGGLTGAS